MWTVLLLLQAAEALVAPMPDGFASKFSDARGGQTIEERVPANETVENWSRMVTVQRFGGGAVLGAHGVLERLGGLMAQSCPGASQGAISDETVDGRAVASVRVDCPLNPQTNKPETMFARAWTGASDLHIVQYAFRSRPSEAQSAAALAYLRSVSLCPGEATGCTRVD